MPVKDREGFIESDKRHAVYSVIKDIFIKILYQIKHELDVI